MAQVRPAWFTEALRGKLRATPSQLIHGDRAASQQEATSEAPNRAPAIVMQHPETELALVSALRNEPHATRHLQCAGRLVQHTRTAILFESQMRTHLLHGCNTPAQHDMRVAPNGAVAIAAPMEPCGFDPETGPQICTCLRHLGCSLGGSTRHMHGGGRCHTLSQWTARDARRRTAPWPTRGRTCFQNP